VYFLYGVLGGMAIENVLIMANTASAICVSCDGAADSIPLKAEVDEAVRLKAFGEFHVRERVGGKPAGSFPP
jgi:hypothetical protein